MIRCTQCGLRHIAEGDVVDGGHVIEVERTRTGMAHAPGCFGDCDRHGCPIPVPEPCVEQELCGPVEEVASFGFVDPISGALCELVVPPGGRCYPSEGEPKIGVVHPHCEELADLSVDLDCFYCAPCGWNGRVSGAWAVEKVEETKALAPSNGVDS